MIRDVRGGLPSLLVILAAAGGCGSSSKTLPCSRSIEELCAASGSCVLTWDEVQSGGRVCALPSVATPLRADCGGTHAVTIAHPDANTTYYYDGTSGMLVAIILSSGTNGTTVCTAGPAGGFAIPVCTGTGSEPLAACLDAGTDAATD